VDLSAAWIHLVEEGTVKAKDPVQMADDGNEDGQRLAKVQNGVRITEWSGKTGWTPVQWC